MTKMTLTFSVDSFIGVTDRKNFLCNINGNKARLPMELTGAPIPAEFPQFSAIKAARAGEQGRGFSVVAEEIRKMAVNSATGVKDIEKILMNIRNKSKLMTDKIMETVANSQEQFAATLEITHLARELASSAEQLEVSARDVIG